MLTFSQRGENPPILIVKQLEASAACQNRRALPKERKATHSREVQGHHGASWQLCLGRDHLEAFPCVSGKQVIKGSSVPNFLIRELQEMFPWPLQRNLAIPGIHHCEALGSPIAWEVVNTSQSADGTSEQREVR